MKVPNKYCRRNKITNSPVSAAFSRTTLTCHVPYPRMGIFRPPLSSTKAPSAIFPADASRFCLERVWPHTDNTTIINTKVEPFCACASSCCTKLRNEIRDDLPESPVDESQFCVRVRFDVHRCAIFVLRLDCTQWEGTCAQGLVWNMRWRVILGFQSI